MPPRTESTQPQIPAEASASKPPHRTSPRGPRPVPFSSTLLPVPETITKGDIFLPVSYDKTTADAEISLNSTAVLRYLDAVKVQFLHQPVLYSSFLDVVEGYQARLYVPLPSLYDVALCSCVLHTTQD